MFSFLTVTWVTLDHLISRLEAGGCDVCNCEAFMRGLVGTQDRGIGHKGEVNPKKFVHVLSNN
jgi:hypothetical protein